MKNFKKGDKVKITGTAHGNPLFGTGTITTMYSGYASIKPDDGSGNWNVGFGDFELLDKEAMLTFASKFLTKDAIKLMKDGYLDVDISASSKMKAEMEALAVDNFIKDYKTK